jgi:DNA-binding GntR family transcriptional regulator
MHVLSVSHPAQAAPMTDSTRQTLAHRIADALTERIMYCEIPPGGRLRQDQIATEFGVSHVPVREAFLELKTRGLAEALPRRGFRVTTLDFAEREEIMAMRTSLEVLALRHAAPAATRSTLIQAMDATHQGESAATMREWDAANRHFHRTILQPCRMPRLLRTIDALHIASTRFLFATKPSSMMPAHHREPDHRSIIDALRDQDTARACAILERHIGRNRRHATMHRPC